ncbi:hypothetical protein DXG01_004914 [Tephrocybe rancida]|nr:hypothetical protein DXG01_004914 [Tephrocybe rancida]
MFFRKLPSRIGVVRSEMRLEIKALHFADFITATNPTMPPSLQGLNIVHPVLHNADSHDLLAGQSYPDLSAQLDLWTNLAFEDDGPLSSKPDDAYRRKGHAEEEEEEAALASSHGSSSGAAAIHDGHTNVVTGTEQHLPTQHHTQQPAFDLSAFLAGFGIDPFSVPPVQAPAALTPSLAQLIAMQGGSAPTLPASASSAPPAKRARTRKASVSTVDSPEDMREDTPGPSPSGVSAAEDKRRRNTAASARFRLKKKEREAALEGKAKELEARVSELERECEGLRRENGWLKGLVVGVTGAAQAPSAPVVSGKRARDEE